MSNIPFNDDDQEPLPLDTSRFTTPFFIITAYIMGVCFIANGVIHRSWDSSAKGLMLILLAEIIDEVRHAN